MADAIRPAVWMPTLRAGTGTDVFTERLCEGLNGRGVRAEIAWLPSRAEYMPWNVRVPPTPSWANLVHLNSWLPRRFWAAPLPTVVTVHHLVHDPAYRPYRSVAQALYHNLIIRERELNAIRSASAVTAVSDYVKRSASQFGGRDDIALIYNWLDLAEFRPGARNHSRQDGRFRILIVGSRSRRKGFDLLPEFARALGDGFQIRCAGGNGSVPHLPNLIDLGRVSAEHLIREYQGSDAVVSLSRYEGFGYTALEAMACGKPFVGFSGSGLSEVVEEGVTGLMVGRGDLNGLVNCCRQLKAQRGLAVRMGLAGRLRAERLFRQSEAIDSYLAIYGQALRALANSANSSP